LEKKERGVGSAREKRYGPQPASHEARGRSRFVEKDACDPEITCSEEGAPRRKRKGARFKGVITQEGKREAREEKACPGERAKGVRPEKKTENEEKKSKRGRQKGAVFPEKRTLCD